MDTHWSVTVSRSGEEIVTIEPNCLSGRDIAPEDGAAIRIAASHLLAFIGSTGAPHAGDQVLREVFTERERQIVHEGFDASHDDDHGDGQLCRAAMGYCQSASTSLSDTSVLAKKPPAYWPWLPTWWKPKTPRRDLIRAAALIVAEIERLDRLAATDSSRGLEFPG